MERVIFGQPEFDIPEVYIDKFDYVISPTMINNNDYDEKVFLDLISCVKLGGFIIFATKLNYFGEDQYAAEIKKLVEQKYWQFTSEHSFYRYDKLCDGVGKFSTKLVKIYAYQKTDHQVWVQEQEELRR